MYITLTQHDDDACRKHIAYGTTYLTEVLEYLGKPVDIRYHMPKYFFGHVVYRVTFGHNPVLTEVSRHVDSSD
jgi:hypothetical protein